MIHRMAHNELLNVLLAHDRWATRQVLDACERLPETALHQRFEIGRGSLHDTLTHMASAITAWADTLGGRPRRPRMDEDGQRRSIAELRAALQAAYDALEAQAAQHAMEAPVTWRLRDGQTLPTTRGTIIAHVATHNMHHRAHCLNMLRRLSQGVPPTGIAEWVLLQNTPAGA